MISKHLNLVGVMTMGLEFNYDPEKLRFYPKRFALDIDGQVPEVTNLEAWDYILGFGLGYSCSMGKRVFIQRKDESRTDYVNRVFSNKDHDAVIDHE